MHHHSIHNSVDDHEHSHDPVSMLAIFLAKAFVVYVLLVVLSGTLINIGHPTVVEAGRTLQSLMLVHPVIEGAQAIGAGQLADGLQLLASGLPVGPLG